MTFGPQITLFGFFVMVYDRVDDGNKFSKKRFGIGWLHFHATSHSKLKLKYFSRKR